MIELICACGEQISVQETDVGQAVICPSCQSVFTPVAAESLEPGAGMGDFDAILLIERGPDRKGESIAIGGVPDIEIGKQARHLKLSGNGVSRLHCHLRRVDFGPSRWQIVDNNSTNGLHVNGKRVSEAELKTGDKVQIGDYVLRYKIAAPVPAAVEPAMAAATGTAPPPPPPPASGRKAVSPAPGLQYEKQKTSEGGTNDGWAGEETQAHKVGFYVIMIPSILAAVVASGFMELEVPVEILCAIVGACGIAGGIINIRGRGPIWAGALIGLVIALGGFGAVAWWIHGREGVRRFELGLAFVVGALPGFGLQYVLQKLLVKKGE